jgi:1-deoxy-D-xylulose-5-phosphate synthase
MMLTALRHDGPIAFRYPRGQAPGVPMDTDPTPVTIGKAKWLREGGDVILVAIGAAVAEALRAHELLAQEGVRAAVVDGRFVKPLDAALIAQIAGRWPLVVTIEENVLQGGFGSAVLEALNDAGASPGALKRIGIPDLFVEHGPQRLLRARYGLDAAGIAKSVTDLLRRQTPRSPAEAPLRAARAGA